MPKVRLSHFSSPPPIDWLWAAVLERKMVFGYDLKRMAKVGGVSYDIMRRYINKSPWEWPPSVREKICKEFGIKQERIVYGAPNEKERGKVC